MHNFCEKQHFSDQNPKDISQTKEKNSCESFEEKKNQYPEVKKKGKGFQQKQNSSDKRNQQGSVQENVLKIQWTQAEENTLIQKHRQIGNKWASISQLLNGKNDNCVKNHFYSKLRKMIRKLNRIIQFYMKKSFKSIPNATIYKLVEASEQRFKQKPICSNQVSMASQDVISKMLKISVYEDRYQEQNINVEKGKISEYKQLIEQINRANKNYKKKSKKIKNSTIKAPVRTKKNSRTKKQKIVLDDDYSADQSQNQSQQYQESSMKPYNTNPKFQHDIQFEDDSKQSKQLKANDKKVQIKEGDQMQQLLKNIGLLHQGKKSRKYNDQKSQFGSQSMKSYSDFQNPSQGLSFFDDSNNCWKKQSRMFTRMNKRLFGGSGSEIEGL